MHVDTACTFHNLYGNLAAIKTCTGIPGMSCSYCNKYLH